MVFRKKTKLNKVGIDFDEILMDSRNIHAFDTQQFEGRIEKTISKRSILLLGGFFVAVLFVFIWRLGALQIKKGGAYFALSEKNSLDSQMIFADRGVIFDRNNLELAWNERTAEMTEFDFSHRAYTKTPGNALLLGYIKYPQKDKAGFYWQKTFLGMDGIEKAENDILNGINGSKIVETSALGEISSQNIINAPIDGKNMILTVDARLQGAMYDSIKTLAETIGYQGGAGAMMDINTGELLVATSYPEYDPQILSDGKDTETINAYLQSDQKPFLNRLVSGLYSPGSTIKPFIAMGALTEGIVTAETTVSSVGEIKVPNPYDETQFTVFRDWKEGGHGITNVEKALAESVNTYFYAIGGGYKGQKGLGISGIEQYVKLFDIGAKTNVDIEGEVAGIIPSPEWKKVNFKNDPVWRLGDTYHTSIGQYGFLVTPIMMLRAMSAIANSGTLVTAHVMQDTPLTFQALTKDMRESDYETVRQGLRKVMTEGTGQLLNVPYVHIAGKTGTAQAGFKNQFVNSWVIGFFPYEKPKYAFVVLMEKGPSQGERSASFAMRSFVDWVHVNAPEYFEIPEV
jgi:penicillin-binding protein 2